MPIEKLKIKKISNVPKYQQIVRGVTEAVDKKRLLRGDKLPSLSEVKKKYNVSINTVVKAYGDLFAVI